LAFSQADQHNHLATTTAATQPAPGQQPAASKPAVPKTEAQLSFDAIKTLAGEWEGFVKTDLPGVDPMANIPLHVTMRVTSRGNVLVHEFQQAETPLDFTKYDHPVTMFYVDQEKLNLVHYCDAGNRPRMVARVAPDHKRVEFDFAELSGSDRYGHMEHAIFTVVDENHHVEEWTFRLKTGSGERVVQARMELKRVQPGSAGSAGAAR